MHETSAEPIDLADHLARIETPWTPHLCATLNDYEFKLSRLEGEFHWHAHSKTDEAFLLVSGRLEIDLLGEAAGPRTVHLGPGQLFVVPRGVQHRPRSVEGCGVLLIEPEGVVKTGD